jgi:quercetin dioxygenase-like cupin family protein
MDKLDRRCALAVGAALVLPLVSMPRSAKAAMYPLDAGKEAVPGVRQVELGEWNIEIGTYKKAMVNDYIFSPSSGFPEEAMKNDMICQIIEGEVWVKQGDKEFTAKSGHVFTCAANTPEEDKNMSNAIAVMRVIDLLPG